jgi:Pyruvate/2-oxoacid:ferredoxin oxidoreductase delta subunit
VPAKYHIHTHPVAPRQRPIGKLGVVDWREDCSNCHNCVKRDCVYGFYRNEADALRDEVQYLDYIYQCKGCLTCIQNCTKGLLTRVVNPEFERLGDDYYTPEIIASNWYQAETGNIPVSGSGYGGPFSGPGFDSMWTDMSEIVRPTRDGIHGREYISTSVDIGRKLPHLTLRDGQLADNPPPLMEIPLPIIFDNLPSHFRRGIVAAAVAKAAKEMGTLFIADGIDTPAGVSFEQGGGIPLYTTGDIAQMHTHAPMVMIPFDENAHALQVRLKGEQAHRLVAIRMEATPESAAQICKLTHDGAEVVHLVFDAHGRENAENPRHMRDVLRDVHRALTKEGVRDLVTLIASGGIAQAEHVAKAIICGADLVAVDLPLMIALECRLCLECKRGELCQVQMEEVDMAFAVQRIVNLMGAWQNQLLEMLGAMGIREVRRLRGETGRCMFFEDLEAASFGRLFGKRKSGV